MANYIPYAWHLYTIGLIGGEQCHYISSIQAANEDRAHRLDWLILRHKGRVRVGRILDSLKLSEQVTSVPGIYTYSGPLRVQPVVTLGKGGGIAFVDDSGFDGRYFAWLNLPDPQTRWFMDREPALEWIDQVFTQSFIMRAEKALTQ